MAEASLIVHRLIATAHSEIRAITTQMRRVVVRVAEKIEQNFLLDLGHATHVGRNGNSEVASEVTTDCLQIFMTEDAVEDPCPSHELIDLIAQHCKIEERYMSVLHTVLGQDSKQKLLALFKNRGIHVDEKMFQGTDFYLFECWGAKFIHR